MDAAETCELGWLRRDTYNDTYSPQLPLALKAILANHGTKAFEPHDPTWRRVVVPDGFLSRVCPMADGILATLKDEQRDGLVGARNHWQMVIDLRPILFQVSVHQIYT